MGKDPDPPAIDSRMLELLACPLTKGRLEFDSVRGELVSRSAMLAYPVRDGIPIMLPSEARDLRREGIAARRGDGAGGEGG